MASRSNRGCLLTPTIETSASKQPTPVLCSLAQQWPTLILVHRVLVAACNHSPSREYEQSPAKTSFERIVAKRRRTLTHKSTRHAAPTSKKRLTQAPYEELTHSNQDAVSRRRTSGETTCPATAADVSILSTADQTTRHSHWHDPQSKQSPNLAFGSGRGTKGASSRCPPFNKKTAQHSRTRQGRPPIPTLILVHRVLVAACNHSPSREYEQSPAKTSFERIVAKRRRTLTHKSTRHAAPTSKKRLTQAPYEELTHSKQDAVSRRRTSGETTSPATAADVSILSTADQTTRHSHWHDPQSKQSPNLAFGSGRGTKGASSRCPPFNRKTAQHSRTRQGRPPIPRKSIHEPSSSFAGTATRGFSRFSGKHAVHRRSVGRMPQRRNHSEEASAGLDRRDEYEAPDGVVAGDTRTTRARHDEGQLARRP
ncbi:hypothetical protein ISCGN_012411 [Ixodes scapularis]